VIPGCGAAAFATAFMPNHVHLVIRSGDAPLSRLMSRLNTSYAVRFNRRHGTWRPSIAMPGPATAHSWDAAAHGPTRM
jgi:REP element-mobilizing transposase RayT